VISANRKY